MPDPLSALDQLLQQDVRQLAVQHLRREQTDFIGRMNQCFTEIDEVFDEFPESDVIDRNQAEQLHSAYCDLAAMAAAQAAILINQHPFLANGDQVGGQPS